MEQGRTTAEQDEVWRKGALEVATKFILNPRETEHNYKLYINSLKRYKTFEEQLKSESGRYVELLTSGSMAESLFATHWVYKDGKREAKNDIDIMLVDFSMKVIERTLDGDISGSVGNGNDFAGVQNNNVSAAELSHGKCCDQKDVSLQNREMFTTGSLQNGNGSESISKDYSADSDGDFISEGSADLGSSQNDMSEGENNLDSAARDFEGESFSDGSADPGSSQNESEGDNNLDSAGVSEGKSTSEGSADVGSSQNESGGENNFESATLVAKRELKEYTQQNLLLKATDHPGYVQLCYQLQEEGNPAFLSTEDFKEFWRGIVNKTALYSLVTSGPQLPSGGVVLKGPALNRRDRPSSRNNYPHDYVPCLKCPEWPSIANKWPERSRITGWPGKDLISEILSNGCHVVPVSHHYSTSYNTEWRISFSLAEKILVHSLSREQRQSYIIAKLIMKQVIQELEDDAVLEKTPSSYHLKTILLWKCEEKNLEEWNDILSSAVELLESFVDHLLRGNIPNYFIPENNMVSHLSQQGLVSVANGLAAALHHLPATLHRVFQAAYGTVLDFDENYFPVLRLVDCQLKIFCQTGTAGSKLFLSYILNSLVDSLSAAIIGSSDELHYLEEHKHILNIYCRHHIAAGNSLALPTPPVLGAAEQHTITMLLSHYLYLFLQNDHILTNLQDDIFAILSRIFTRTLPVISLNLSQEISCECCKESLRVYQTVCKKLKIERNSILSCREELSTLHGLQYIFSKFNELAGLENFEFATQRFQKFKTNGQLEKVKSLEW